MPPAIAFGQVMGTPTGQLVYLTQLSQVIGNGDEVHS